MEDDLNDALFAAAPDMLAALLATKKDPHGCRFCDSGRLRTPSDPTKSHDDDCGFALADAAIVRAAGGKGFILVQEDLS